MLAAALIAAKASAPRIKRDGCSTKAPAAPRRAPEMMAAATATKRKIVPVIRTSLRPNTRARVIIMTTLWPQGSACCATPAATPASTRTQTPRFTPTRLQPRIAVNTRRPSRKKAWRQSRRWSCTRCDISSTSAYCEHPLTEITYVTGIAQVTLGDDQPTTHSECDRSRMHIEPLYQPLRSLTGICLDPFGYSLRHRLYHRLFLLVTYDNRQPWGVGNILEMT